MSTPKIVFEPAKDDSGKPCVQWQIGALGGYARTTEEAANDAITLIVAQRDRLLEELKAIDHATRNCPCMSLQAEHEFARCQDANGYRTALAGVVLAIRSKAVAAIASCEKGPQ